MNVILPTCARVWFVNHSSPRSHVNQVTYLVPWYPAHLCKLQDEPRDVSSDQRWARIILGGKPDQEGSRKLSTRSDRIVVRVELREFFERDPCAISRVAAATGYPVLSCALCPFLSVFLFALPPAPRRKPRNASLGPECFLLSPLFVVSVDNTSSGVGGLPFSRQFALCLFG